MKKVMNLKKNKEEGKGKMMELYYNLKNKKRHINKADPALSLLK